MSDSQSLGPIEGDVRSLSERLAAFSKTLPPRETAILALVMRDVAGAGDEVQGFGWWDAQSPDGWFGLLNRALLDVAVAHGMVLDEDTLAAIYAPDSGQPAAGADASQSASSSAS